MFSLVRVVCDRYTAGLLSREILVESQKEKGRHRKAAMTFFLALFGHKLVLV